MPPWMRLTYLVGAGLTLVFFQAHGWELRQLVHVTRERGSMVATLAICVVAWPVYWAAVAGAELAKYLERRGPPPTGA